MRCLSIVENIMVALACLLFVFVGCKSKSHTAIAAKEKDSLAQYPYWIAMMDDPNVNYYKAVEAFDKYWENREKPTENDGEGKDIFGKDKGEREKENKETIDYVFEYKRFLNWQQRNKNLVKPNGTIMTPEEIIEQWKKFNNDSLNR